MKSWSKMTTDQRKFLETYTNENFIAHVSNLMVEKEIIPIEPNKEYPFMCSDCPGPKSSWRYENQTTENYYDPELTYKLNNFTFRSDDFDKEKASSNMLYSGCSFTFGVGVPYKSIWSNMLNDSLGYKDFYSLAICGGSFESIIFDIYTYIKKFGAPKGIVTLFPPPIRVMSYSEEENAIRMIPFRVVHMNDVDEKRFFKDNRDLLSYDLWTVKFYHMITALELYLESIGVKFLWGCWDIYVNKIFSQISGLKNYINIDGGLADKFRLAVELNEIDYSNYVNKYWVNARDTHPSVKEHFVFYKIFESEWIKRYGEKN